MALRTRPPNGRRIDLVGIGLLHQLTTAQAAHGHEHDHDILQSDRHGILQNVLQQFAAIAQAQVVEQRLHDGRVAGITDGAVIEIAHLAGEGFAKSAEAARGVECLVQNAVEGEFFQFLERLCFAQLGR